MSRPSASIWGRSPPRPPPGRCFCALAGIFLLRPVFSQGAFALCLFGRCFFKGHMNLICGADSESLKVFFFPGTSLFLRGRALFCSGRRRTFGRAMCVLAGDVFKVRRPTIWPAMFKVMCLKSAHIRSLHSGENYGELGPPSGVG